MGTASSSSLDNRATLTAFAFLESFGFSFSNFNFLFAAVALKLLSDIKWVGPCFFLRVLACFSGLGMI
jgi:Na+-translocating ferredoxin:NAD+ oxidoreductase RnfD subunit